MIQKVFSGFFIVSLGFFIALSSASAQSAQDLQLLIQNLLNQVALLQSQLQVAQGGEIQTSPSSQCSFTRNLFVGVRGDDVRCLQAYLNANQYAITLSGPGSLDNETTYFGALTRSALQRWQAANNISPAAGYFGPISQTKYRELIMRTSEGGEVESQITASQDEGISSGTYTGSTQSLSPVAYSLSPSSGPPGTVVTVHGENFLPIRNTLYVGYDTLQLVPSSDGTTLQYTFSPPLDVGVITTEPLTYKGLYLEGFVIEDFSVSTNPTTEEVAAILQSEGLVSEGAVPLSPGSGTEHWVYVENENGRTTPLMFIGMEE